MTHTKSFVGSPREHSMQVIMGEEGYRRTPYHCPAGKLTVGYGRNLQSVGIDPEEATYLFSRDFEKAESICRLEAWWGDMAPLQRYAQVEMVFILGERGWRRFKKMHEALQRKDSHRAADEILDSRMHDQLPMRTKRIAEWARG
jgi:lysozyme